MVYLGEANPCINFYIDSVNYHLKQHTIGFIELHIFFLKYFVFLFFFLQLIRNFRSFLIFIMNTYILFRVIYECTMKLEKMTNKNDFWKKVKISKLGVLDTTLCDKVCQWLATGWWFSLDTPVSSTNKMDGHVITEILLNEKKLMMLYFYFSFYWYLRKIFIFSHDYYPCPKYISKLILLTLLFTVSQLSPLNSCFVWLVLVSFYKDDNKVSFQSHML